MLDRNIDQAEKHNRKSSLGLGGDFSEHNEVRSETLPETIKNKFKVDVNRGIAACHKVGKNADCDIPRLGRQRQRISPASTEM